MMSPGTAYFGDSQFMLDTNGMVRNVEDLNELPIRIQPGSNVYLKDIGHAEDSYAIQTSRVRINGRQQVYVPIYRQGGASTLAVSEGVRKEIKNIEQRLPEGTKINFVMDQSEYVRKSIEALVHEGLIGAALVSVMILIFLGNWRMTLIACISIPLSLLGAVIGLYVTSNTINVMTLGGMALAIGPLVDDAIVVLENHHRHSHMGKPALKAAFDSCAEVMVPVLVATCTTNIVLAPLALMPGMGGFLFRPLALAVTFSMVCSFVLSRTFVPMACGRFLPDSHRHHTHVGPHSGFFGRIHQYIDVFLHRINTVYGHLLGVALRYRWGVLGAVFLLFVGSMALTPLLGREFFPQIDAGQISIQVRAPSNTRLDANEKRIAELEKFIEAQIPPNEREMVVSEMGLNPDWSAAYTQNAGQQDTVIRVQLTNDRKLSAQEYAIKLRHALQGQPRFSDLGVNFDTGGMISAALNYGASSPIDVEIDGGTTDQAFGLAGQIRDRATTVRGTADVRVLQRMDAPYLILDVDRQKAASVGLSARDVIVQVVAAMNSSTSIDRNFWIDPKSGNQYFVAVQYPEDAEATTHTLEGVFATGTNQSSPVTIGSLVSIRSSTAAVETSHKNGRRVFNVLINTENRDVAGVARDVTTAIKGLTVPAGVHVSLKGEYARMNESARSLGFGLAMASVLVYLLLMALFRSFKLPFIIMFTVPLGLIGVITMLFATRTTLNVQSEMGVIFLVGIVVSNGVLLLDFAGQRRREGMSAREAITRAATVRFRPILMTFLATFLDLIPMAIGLGKGSEANIPLARAVVGGLLTSTALTLFVVPILYTLLAPKEAQSDAEVDAALADTPAGAVPTPVPVH
jgi:multidrug efflux pump subunit AcrB